MIFKFLFLAFLRYQAIKMIEASKETEAVTELLERVIDKTEGAEIETHDVEIIFFATEAMHNFKQALGEVKTKATLEQEDGINVLKIRPLDLAKFGERINARGLEHSRMTRKVLQWLDRNPEEYLRFVTER